MQNDPACVLSHFNTMNHQKSIDVSLIDAGLTSLKDLKLSVGIVYLNVHCNKIQKIENISNLTSLKHLDLSSNKINMMSGISSCSSLQTLNLSCNCIQRVEGITELINLRKLDLSYNDIRDISGFKCITKRSHCLTQVDLYGNKLALLKHVTQSLMQSNCILHLALQKGTNDNPVCRIPAYRPNMLSQIPWLESLDGRDKTGKPVVGDSVNMHDIPGLSEYLEFLEPSVSNSSFGNASANQSASDLFTPRIDSILDRFAKRDESNLILDEVKDSEDLTAKECNKHVSERLESLENKLVSLLKLHTQKQSIKNKNVMVTFDSIDASDAVSSDDMDEVDSYPVTNEKTEDRVILNSQLQEPKQNQQQKQQQYFEIKPGQKKQDTRQKIEIKAKSGISQHKNIYKNVSNSKVDISSARDPSDILVKGTKLNIGENTKSNDDVRQVRSTKDDETFLSLLNEIDKERERRWKAEQASKKLLENIKILQEKLSEERKIQEAAITSSTKCKRELNSEREGRSKYEDLSCNLEEENISLKAQLSELERSCKEKTKLLEELQLSIQKLEKDKMEEGLFQEKRFKELQFDVGGSERQIKLLENTFDKQKSQISQLQELIVSREQEHKDTLVDMVSIDSREVRDLMRQEIDKSELKNTELIKQKDNLLKEAKINYEALEDEFRMALQIEANRYNQLHALHEECLQELKELKLAFEETSQKDAKSRSLLTEFTALVKEQKARISEMSQSKQDIQAQYKERLGQLEIEVTNLRKFNIQVDSLQQDKDRMAAHIRGQESVIQGLRSERKLWGLELAQQGSSLAQEKGKINAQLEAQENEIANLQTQLKECNNTLKIKSKVIEDQTNTIKDLKEECFKHAEEKKKLVGDSNIEVQGITQDLDNAKDQIEELQETATALTDRKKELKSQLASVEDELKQSRDELKTLQGQWDERSKMIDKLESKVVKMKSNFDEKEKTLLHELNLEKEKFLEADGKLKTIENHYKTQLTTLKHDFNLELRKVIAQKDDEVQSWKQQVNKVEEEMKILLIETTNQKKTMESRVANISKAFLDMQKELTES